MDFFMPGPLALRLHLLSVTAGAGLGAELFVRRDAELVLFFVSRDFF